MGFKMKNIFILILFFSSIVFGQVNKIDGLYATNLDARTNYVKNKSCTTNLNNITTSGTITLTKDTTTKLDQGASCKAVATAAGQAIKFQVYNLDDKLQSGDCSTTAVYVGATAGAFKTYINLNGTKISLTEQQIASSTTAKQVTAYHTCNTGPSNTYEVVFESTAAGTINVADVVVGKTDRATVGVNTSWQPYTPILTNFGSPTGVEFYWRRVGDTVYVKGSLTSGTFPGSEVRVGLPGTYISKTFSSSNLVAGKWGRGEVTTNHGGFVLQVSGANYVTMSDSGTFNNSSVNALVSTTSLSGSGVRLAFEFAVEIQGLAESETYVNSRCTSDLACENVFSASISGAAGVVSNESLDWINGNCTRNSVGNYTCNFNSGTFSTNPNCTVTSLSGTGSAAGIVSVNANSINFTTYLTSTGAVTDYSAVLSCQKQGTDFKAKQNIVGYLGNMRVESASVSSSGVVTENGSVDWINGNCSSSSPYTCNFNSGVFSVAPVCVFTNVLDGGGYLTASPTSTGFTYRTILTTSGGTTNIAFNVVCVGPR